MTKSDIFGIPGAKIRIVGLSWFHDADYTAILRIMTDAELLPDTYDEWFERESKRESDLKASGHIVIRAIIDPKTFPDWCAKHGHTTINSSARAAFANDYATRQIRH